LLLAAAELLVESGDRTLSTRAVCERAGVQAPTLYHHFGNKQGLIDAVIEHGFTQYVRPPGADTSTGNPLDDLRQGWDQHVQFGLDHPSFYALLYGNIEPGRPCGVTGPAMAMLTSLLNDAARAGLLRVPPESAAAHLFAANVGVTLSLIAQPPGAADLALSRQVREGAIAAVTLDAPPAAPSRSSAAIALTAALDDDDQGLTPGELALLRELLARLGPTA
jgi:AcrR family transcriptional regulator